MKEQLIELINEIDEDDELIKRIFYIIKGYKSIKAEN